jgi:lipid II:glycine glycyltransferase (peptidoglycan interpeptide bridge formation enzyme)
MIWNSFLSKNDRRKINVAERNGWKIEEAKSEEELRGFYAYCRANLQYLRVRDIPEFSFFAYLMKTFSPNEMLVFLLRKGETVAGGALVFLFERKKTMYGAYGALNREAPARYSPFVSLMWHMVKKASATGYTTVSFGFTPRNPDPHYRIKAKFGCRFEPRYEVTFPRLGVLVNSAVTRLDSIVHTISATQLHGHSHSDRSYSPKLPKIHDTAL